MLRRQQAYWNTGKRVPDGGLAYTPPLDVYGSGVFGGWSPTRKLKSDYSGYACRMTDNGNVNTYEIPFDSNGLVDIAYVVSTSLSVSSRLRCILIYDQSGNGNNLTCTANGFFTDASASYNPNMLGGFPVMNRTNHYINLAAGVFENNDVKSIFSVGAPNSSSGTFKSFGTRNGGGPNGWLWRTTATSMLYARVGGSTVSASVSLSQDQLYINGFTFDSGFTARLYKDGSLLGSGSSSGGTSNNVLGNIDSSAGADFDYFIERIAWEADKTSDAIAIQTNMNDFYGIY